MTPSPASAAASFRRFQSRCPTDFRDVYDHLVRLSDEAVYFQDRISSLLDAHLSNVSNQLNSVMKVLTIISTIFMPMTVLTGMYGMNVPLPHLPGGEHAQFWWIVAIMASVTIAMLTFFRRRMAVTVVSRQSGVGSRSRQSESAVPVDSQTIDSDYRLGLSTGTIDSDYRLGLSTRTDDCD